jgi:hypothetical protein
MLPYGIVQSTRLPAPEVEVEVFSLDQPIMRVKVICVVDTAATISVIPRFLVERLGPLDYSTCEMEWGQGYRTSQKRFKLAVKVGSALFAPLWVITNEKRYGLIGRDLLNAHLLTCDGPQKIWATNPSWL